MKTIIVTNQKEYDNAINNKDQCIIEIKSNKPIEIISNKTENHTVTAHDSSTVAAYGSSTVTAHDSSTVTACDRSTVRAYDSSRVRACGSSTVRACDFSTILILSSLIILKKLEDYCTILLNSYKVKLPKISKKIRIFKEKRKYTTKKYTDIMNLEIKDNYVIMYKIVNPDTECDFRTGKIKYTGKVKCPDWNPDSNLECGNGLHVSPTLQDARQYNQGLELKVRVNLNDFVVFPDNLSKVRCKQLEVIEKLNKKE